MAEGMTRALDLPFEEAVERTRAALAEQGFGVITEIDVTATLQEKIGKQIEEYTILGACNPNYAARALEHDRSIGVMLPCNVVVRASDGGSLVEAFDPQSAMQIPGFEAMGEIADDVRGLLQAALDSL